MYAIDSWWLFVRNERKINCGYCMSCMTKFILWDKQLKSMTQSLGYGSFSIRVVAFKDFLVGFSREKNLAEILWNLSVCRIISLNWYAWIWLGLNNVWNLILLSGYKYILTLALLLTSFTMAIISDSNRPLKWKHRRAWCFLYRVPQTAPIYNFLHSQSRPRKVHDTFMYNSFHINVPNRILRLRSRQI